MLAILARRRAFLRGVDRLEQEERDRVTRPRDGAALARPTGGTFGTYLSRLRSNGLIDESNKKVRAAPALMEGPRT